MYHWKIHCKAIVSTQYRIIGNFTVGKSRFSSFRTKCLVEIKKLYSGVKA